MEHSKKSLGPTSSAQYAAEQKKNRNVIKNVKRHLQDIRRWMISLNFDQCCTVKYSHSPARKKLGNAVC